MLEPKTGTYNSARDKTNEGIHRMTEAAALKMAEKYLKEMLEADDTGDFELYTKRLEEKYTAGFTRERFASDIKGMHERNGMNSGYELLGTLRNSSFDGLLIYRSVWKGIYEKRDAVIEFAVYEKDGAWYVIQSAVH